MLRNHQIDRPRTEPPRVLPAEAQETARDAGLVGAILDLLERNGADLPGGFDELRELHCSVARAWKSLKVSCDDFDIEPESVELRVERR